MEQTEEKKQAKNPTKIGAVIILVISAIVFIPTGGAAILQSLLGKGQTPDFGTYHGQKIEYKAGSRFATTVARVAERYEQQGYRANTIESDIFQQAYIQTIEEIFFEDAVNQSGYIVPESAVNRMILPYYTDENGIYSQRIYNQTDAATRSERRTTAEEDLVRLRFQDDVFGSSDSVGGAALYGTKAAHAEGEFVTAMGTERHAFELAAFSTDDLPADEVVRYGRDNAATFTRYDYSAITVGDEREARTLLKQLQGNELTFEDAVTETSELLYTGSDGKLSSPYHYQLLSTVRDEADVDAILALQTGALSGVVPTVRGYTIFRKDGEPVAADMSDPTIQSVVKSYILSTERGYVENYYTEVARNFITDAATLKEQVIPQEPTRENPRPDPIIRTPFQQACDKYGVTRTQTDAFPLNYGNSPFFDSIPGDVTELTGLAQDSAALETLFALKEAELSKPFVLGGKVLVARCTGITTDTEDAPDAETYAQMAQYYDERSAVNNLITTDMRDAYSQAYNTLMQGRN